MKNSEKIQRVRLDKFIANAKDRGFLDVEIQPRTGCVWVRCGVSRWLPMPQVIFDDIIIEVMAS